MNSGTELTPVRNEQLAYQHETPRLPAWPHLPQPHRSDTHDGDLRRFISVLLKHRRGATIFALSTIGAVALATFLMKPIYEPEGRIQIDPPGQETFSMQSNNGPGDSDYVATEAEKIRTAELSRATIQALQLNRDPELVGKATAQAASADDSSAVGTEAITQFQSHLSVRRNQANRLVGIRFASHDAQLSARVVNTLMDLFVQSSYQARHDAISQSSTWLARQLDDIRDKFQKSSAAVENFQKAHGIVETDHDSTTLSQAVGELNKQLADAESQRMQLEAYLNRTGEEESLPQVASNPVVQGLTQKRADVSAQLAETQVTYGPNHPNVRKLQNQVEELDRQLAAERSSLKADLRTTYTAAQRRESMLQKQLRDASQQLGQMEQYTSLKKQAQADRDLYDSLYAKIKESGIAAASKSSNIRVVERASVLDHPTRPRRLLNLLLGTLFGILGGIVLAFVKEGLEDRIQTAEDVRAFTGLSSVILVPNVAEKGRKKLTLHGTTYTSLKNGGSPRMLLGRPNSPESEAVNALRTFVVRTQPDTQQRVLMVTSPLPGDGKTTVALNLAASLAKMGRTCLIDADLRRPRIADALRLRRGNDFVDLLKGMVTLESVIVRAPQIDGLSVIGCWSPTHEAGELLSRFPMTELIDRLRVMFDYVLLDTPPLLPYSEGRALSTVVDGIILVGRAANTPRMAMTRTVELLNEIRSAPICTVVLNGVDFRSPQYRYYSY
jgi:capsular exopolysaccharide synthesis family protein